MGIEVAFAATAAANTALALVALMQMRLSRRHADNATLPIVVPSEVKEPAEQEGGTSYAYVLVNEGKGPAINVQHGVELDGTLVSFGDDESPYNFRIIREGESMPPEPDDDAIDPLVVWGGDQATERIYWVRYESLNGEVFEVRNSYHPSSHMSFRRLSRMRHAVGLSRRVRSTPADWTGRRARLR